ncbi:MAG: type II secretion system protein N [Comamonadaceae bacterium]|nr:MAG: type II secretion system protein N [Comamonadaceae bacterium]
MKRLPRHSGRTGQPGHPANGWRWAFAGAFTGLLLAIMLFAPARWLAAAVNSASRGHVVFAEPRGTVWSGSATLLLTGGEGSRDAQALPGSVQWRVRPAGLGLAGSISADCCTAVPIGWTLRPKWGGASLAWGDGQSRWPSALLAGLGTPWNTLAPEGQLLLATQGVVVDWNAGRVSFAGSLRLDAMNLMSRMSTLRPLGSYRLTLAGGAAPTLQLETLEGALQMSGNGQWTGSRLRFEGVATAAPGREAVLSNLLNIIGLRQGSRSIITLG